MATFLKLPNAWVLQVEGQNNFEINLGAAFQQR